MNIVLLGAPGSGKGTQSSLIAKQYNLAHISTGDLLRDASLLDTTIGREISNYLKAGQLVPDEVINKLLVTRLSMADAKGGYILDGYPRTLSQAISLNEFSKVDIVIFIDTDYKYILDRILTRSVCKDCKDTLRDIDLINGRCPKCKGETFKRSDDNEQTLLKRFDVFKNQTNPVINYYLENKLLVSVNGNAGIEEIFEKIKQILDGLIK